MKRLVAAVRSYLNLPVIGQLGSLQIEGAMIDAAGGQAFLNALALAAAPATVPIRFSVVTNASTTAQTLTPANASEGIVNAWVVASGGSANTNTTDTATNIINGYWPNATVGAVSGVYIVNNNTGTMTLALGMYRAKVTNLANPVLAGSVSTNSTTTSAAVTNNAGVNNPTSVINVASATGINANASYLQVVQIDGTTGTYFVTAVNTLAITVAGNINKNIASGAAVTVFNNTITITRMFSTVTATTAA